LAIRLTTRREVLSGFLVVLFVEAPNQLLEHRAHAVVVQARKTHAPVLVQNVLGRQVDLGVHEVADQVAQDVGFHQRLDLVVELELGQDLAHVRGEAI
jgi:hypothetical protein